MDINITAKTKFLEFEYSDSSKIKNNQKFIYRGHIVSCFYRPNFVSVESMFPIELKSEAEFIDFSSQLYDWLKTILIDPLPRKEIFLAELTHWHQKFVSYTGKPLAEWYTGDLTEWRPFEEGRVSRIDLDYDASKQEEHLSNSIDGFFSKNPFGCDEQYLHQIQGWTIQYKRIAAHCFFLSQDFFYRFFPHQSSDFSIFAGPNFFRMSIFTCFFMLIAIITLIGFILHQIIKINQKRKLKGQI